MRDLLATSLCFLCLTVAGCDSGGGGSSDDGGGPADGPPPATDTLVTSDATADSGTAADGNPDAVADSTPTIADTAPLMDTGQPADSAVSADLPPASDAAADLPPANDQAAVDGAQSDLPPGTDGATTSLTYPIVDTGQALCSSVTGIISCPQSGAAFFGQDAQYQGNQASYSVNAGGLTVTDNVTGLVWQQSPDVDGDGSVTASDKMTYTAALARCASLASAGFGGFSDWRLPSIKELYSLIDFRGTDPSGLRGSDTSGLVPFIDASVFHFDYGDTGAGERIIDAQYAASTLYVNKSATGADMLFGVNFADGRIKGYDLTMPSGSTKTFTVLCVRGNPSYGINSFKDNGDQTITDQATGLMWTKADSGAAMEWQAALAWIQSKNAASYLGHNDWRLPNAKELQSILDYTRSPQSSSSAAIDPIFDATPITNEAGAADYSWYWSSTTHKTYTGSMGSAAYLAFGRAGGWQQLGAATCYTLNDVHGAGAQRSDPTEAQYIQTLGTACTGGTAYGHGPQGDVQRGKNVVRLVRGGAVLTGGTTFDGGVLADSGPPPFDGGPPPPFDGGPPATDGGSSCGSCPANQVCCTAPLPCAGQCVPDCRLGGSCPSPLTCDQASGICKP